MAKRNQNDANMLHDSIDRLEQIKDQDAGDNEIFTRTIDTMIKELFDLIQREWKKRNAKPKKRSKTYVPDIHTVTQKGNDKNG